MLIYIVKTVACMAILFFFYKLFLEQESMHVFKRFYLLFVLGFSLIVPALVFTEYIEVTPAPEIAFSENQPVLVTEGPIGIPQALETDVLDAEPLLWGIYFIGLSFFGIKFIKNLWQISGRIRKNPKQKASRFTNVLLKEIIPPHTFFNYIFLNKRKFEADEIPKEVLLHEETHAQQKHSIDVVIVEFLHVLFWFNPFLYFLKKSVKLNHEFLADEAVLKNNIDKATYQNTLLSYVLPDSQKRYQPLANAINYSSIKKRFTIMKTQTSKKGVLLRSLTLLPLLTLLVYGFSETNLVQVQQKNSPMEQELKEINSLNVNYVDDVEIILININKKGQLLVQDDLVALDQLQEFLSKINTHLSKEQKRQLVKTIIKVDSKAPKSVIERVNQIVTDNGSATIDILGNGYDLKLEKRYGVSKVDLEKYNSLAKKYNAVPIEKRSIPLSDLKILETVFRKMNQQQKTDAQPFPECLPKNVQDGASRELMKEYNSLAKKYNAMLSKSKSIQIKMKDVNRLEYIYGLMSKKQKANAEPFPNFPEPPPAPKAPGSPNEREEAAATVKKIIEEQDPYDFNTNGMQISLKNAPAGPIAPKWPDDIPSKASLNYYRPSPVVLKGEVSEIPIPPLPSNQKVSQKQNNWVVSSGAKRNSRQDKNGIPVPPVAPTIALHSNTNKYSKELNNLIQDYLKKNNAYEKAVNSYLKKDLGNRRDLWNNYNEVMEGYVAYYDLARKEGHLVQPMAPQAPKVLKSEISNLPTPPPPIDPLDYVIEMAKKNARFYYEGKEISSDKAIALMKKNKDINIDSRSPNGKRPVVKLSTEPIVIEN